MLVVALDHRRRDIPIVESWNFFDLLKKLIFLNLVSINKYLMNGRSGWGRRC